MNPTAADPVPPPPPPQAPRSSFSCNRHPDEQFTGFCPSCLCERLTTLDQSSSNSNNHPSASSSRRSSTSAAAAATAAAALKSLFSKPSSSSATSANPLPPRPSKQPTTTSSSLFPELRRTKSFSASKNDAGGLNFSAAAFEPQRKSCDVRVRNTLLSLFTLDNDSRTTTTTSAATTSAAAAASSSQTHRPHYIVNEAFLNRTVFESKEEEEDDDDVTEQEVEETDEEYNEIKNNDGNVVDQISEVQQQPQPRISCSEIVEEEVGNFATMTKPMKDHIDLQSQEKKNSGGGVKEIAGSFWSAASVFSKKWHNWRRKQKLKKQHTRENSAATLPVEKPLSRQYRDTQSELADYGFGRRSCDTDPRFSLDAGRISFDDPRYSFDEPRASWDGYLLGRSFPRMHPLMENAPVVNIPRPDMKIHVEESQIMINCITEDENVPGGSAQTREYYTDSSSRRRKSFDRCSSIRKTAAAVVAEIDEMKAASNANAKVSPATVDSVNGAKVLAGEGVMRDSNPDSVRGDYSETVGLRSLMDSTSIAGNGEQKGSKKSRRWNWNIWGIIHKISGVNKDEDDERYSSANGVERSYSESWQDLRREGNGEARGGLSRRVLRSNSSVTWRNSSNFGGSFGSLRKSGIEMNDHRKKREELVLERNRSARYSPNNDNGLLRFYLTPLRSSRRGAPIKNRLNGSHSIARSVLRLY